MRFYYTYNEHFISTYKVLRPALQQPHAWKAVGVNTCCGGPGANTRPAGLLFHRPGYVCHVSTVGKVEQFAKDKLL